MSKENEELKKRMSGVEEMVANLIINQQAMAKAFQEHGDRHSGSLERHRADLNSARREIDRLQVNQSTIVDECSVLCVSAFILIPFSTIFITQLTPLSLLSPYASLCLPTSPDAISMILTFFPTLQTPTLLSLSPSS